jgi:hypothetical protein
MGAPCTAFWTVVPLFPMSAKASASTFMANVLALPVGA